MRSAGAIAARCFGAYWLILVIVSLIVQLIAVPITFGTQQTLGMVFDGDVVRFHEEAAEIAARIRERGWREWELKPYGWGHVGISSALYAVFGAYPVVLLPVSAFFLATAFWMVRECLVRVGVPQGLATLALVPVVCLPTTLMILTQWHKDVVAVPASIAIMFGCIVAAADRRLALGLSIIAVGTTGLWLVREHLVLPLGIACMGGALAAIVAVALRKRAVHRMERVLLLTSATCVVLIAQVLPDWSREHATAEFEFAVQRDDDTYFQNELEPLNWDPLVTSNTELLSPSHQERLGVGLLHRLAAQLDRQFFAIGSMRAAAQRGMAHGCASIDAEVVLNSAADIISYIPRAMIVGTLAPFPNAWIAEACSGGGRSLRLLSGLEMSIFYLALLGLFVAGWRWGHSPLFWFLLASCAALLLLHGLIFVNAGTLMRVRYAFLMVPMVIGTAGWLSLLAPNLRRLTTRISKYRFLSARPCR